MHQKTELSQTSIGKSRVGPGPGDLEFNLRKMQSFYKFEIGASICGLSPRGSVGISIGTVRQIALLDTCAPTADLRVAGAATTIHHQVPGEFQGNSSTD